MTSKKKNIDQLIELFIQQERNIEPNPFLSTRIMAALEHKQNNKFIVVSPAWRTAGIALSLITAVLTGIATGNIYQSKNNTNEVVLMNDDKMENFELYKEIGNE